MKLIKFIPIAFAGISLLGLTSCQNDSEPQIPNQEETTCELTPLGEVLANAVMSHKDITDGDTYIIYDASSDTFTVMSADDYAIADAFAEVIVHDGSYATRAPKGNGWTIGGRGKGRTQAINLAFKLAQKLEKNRDFEIHVEYDEKNNFTVWYRYV